MKLLWREKKKLSYRYPQQTQNEITKNSVRFADKDLWVTQDLLAEIQNIAQQNISQHIECIYRDTDLDREAMNKKFLFVWKEETGFSFIDFQ